jgi:hypothetical protein
MCPLISCFAIDLSRYIHYLDEYIKYMYTDVSMKHVNKCMLCRIIALEVVGKICLTRDQDVKPIIKGLDFQKANMFMQFLSLTQ